MGCFGLFGARSGLWDGSGLRLLSACCSGDSSGARNGARSEGSGAISGRYLVETTTYENRLFAKAAEATVGYTVENTMVNVYSNLIQITHHGPDATH